MGNQGYEEDLLAAIYDDDNPDGPDHDYFRRLAQDLSAAAIVDLGCGTGILTVTLAGEGRDVVGIDPAEAMLKRAANRHGGDLVDWRLGTSELIEPDSADLIVMTGNVAMHILGDAWHESLRDIARGLRRGGVLAFETRNPLARAWLTWGSLPLTRETAVGRLRESTTISGPDGDGIVTMDSANDFLDAGRVIEVSQQLQFRSFETVVEDLNTAGLSVRNVWRDWERTPAVRPGHAPLLVFEATKP